RRRSLSLPGGAAVRAPVPLPELRRAQHPRQRADPALGRGRRAARCRAARLRRRGPGDRAPAAAVQPALLRTATRARAAELLGGAVPGEPGTPRRAGAGAPAARDPPPRRPGVAPGFPARLPRLLRQPDRLPAAAPAPAWAGAGSGAGREPRALRPGLAGPLPAAERAACPARRRARPARGAAAGARGRAPAARQG